MVERREPPLPYEFLPPVAEFSLQSNDVSDGAPLQSPQVSGIFGAGGDDVSPHLRWEGHPEGTRSFAVTCFDPDAPTGSGFWHWVLFDLPPDVHELQTGAGDQEGSGLPAGATQVRNDAGLPGYLGAAPPQGHGPHRYVFAVHALDVESLGPGADATPALVGFSMFGHTLGRAVLTATYEQ